MTTGESSTQYVAASLDRCRQGDWDGAFHDFIEAGQKIIPQLIEAYRNEPDAKVRDFIVEVIWQNRQPSTIPFLGEALLDPDASVWKQAVDGLVTLASTESANKLRSVGNREFSRQADAAEFRVWIDEAIEQIENQSTRP
jgi:HEAT repeats